jgi:hypothetical protein
VHAEYHLALATCRRYRRLVIDGYRDGVTGLRGAIAEIFVVGAYANLRRPVCGPQHFVHTIRGRKDGAVSSPGRWSIFTIIVPALVDRERPDTVLAHVASVIGSIA